MKLKILRYLYNNSKFKIFGNSSKRFTAILNHFSPSIMHNKKIAFWSKSCQLFQCLLSRTNVAWTNVAWTNVPLTVVDC